MWQRIEVQALSWEIEKPGSVFLRRVRLRYSLPENLRNATGRSRENRKSPSGGFVLIFDEYKLIIIFMERGRSLERESRVAETFSEQLGRIWKERYPEVVAANLEQQQNYQDHVEKTEKEINDREVLEVLQEYGIPTESIEQIDENLFRIPVNHHFSERPLPPGYHYIGGAARALFMRSLNIDPTYTPRDLDLVRIISENPENSLDESVGWEFSPEDAAFGHGVQVEKNTQDYFTSRDLTINEVMANDREIVITRQGMLDSVRRIIRLSDHEKSDAENQDSSKMMAKMLRLYVEGINRWGDAHIDDEKLDFEKFFITPFFLALQLDKASEIGTNIAEAYVDELVSRGQLPMEISKVEEAARYLAKFLREDVAFYRHAPLEQFQLEDEWITTESLPKHQSFNREQK